MARNEIILSADPKGHFIEGIISGTPKPGTCMQLVPATEEVNGHFTYRVADIAQDGEMCEIIILLDDYGQGKKVTDAYVSGDLARMYIPVPGDVLQVLFGNASGTADDVVIGGKLIVDDTTGKFIPTTGSPEQEPFVALQTYTDPTADQLIMARRL